MCTKCHFSREEQFCCCLQFRWYFILTDFTAVVLKIWEILQRIRELLENWWNVSQSTFLHEIVTAARDDFAVRIIIIFIVFDTSKLTTRAEHSSRWAEIRAKSAFKTFLFFDTEDVSGNDLFDQLIALQWFRDNIAQFGQQYHHLLTSHTLFENHRKSLIQHCDRS